MAKVIVDFSDVEKIAALPKGRYAASVEKVVMRPSNSSEYPYLNWEWRITEGEYEGRVVFMMTSLSPKALWNLQGVMESLGMPDQKLEFETDEESGLVISPDLAGRPAIIGVIQEPYENRINNKVTSVEKYVLPTAAQAPVPAPQIQVTRPPAAVGAAPQPIVIGGRTSTAPKLNLK